MPSEAPGPVTSHLPVASPPPFVHQAWLYADDDDLAGMIPFIEAGIEAGEPVLVAVPSPRLEMLRAHLDGGSTGLLRFAPMEEMGRNPAWIIPAWTDFIASLPEPGMTARGIGEPVWTGRSPDELVECGRHEALLNLAFAGSAGFQLLCPYDAAALHHDVLDEAHRNHPHVGRPGAAVTSRSFEHDVPAWLDTPLPPPPVSARTVAFDDVSLRRARQLVGDAAALAGLPPNRIDELAIAVSEVVTNSVVHGGGGGELTVWQQGSMFLCEIRDRGRIADPLAGRRRPPIDGFGGRGLWLVNQLCDLVQLRIVPQGQAIRLHVSC